MPQAPVLSVRALNRATLARQGLIEPIGGKAADAVRRVASLQAQHPEWPPLALAARAASRRTAGLSRALARREVARSSLMRITIHVVAADDLWPMFAVCQPLRLGQWQALTRVDPMRSRLGRRLLAAHPTAVSALREAPRSSLEVDRLLAREAGIDPDGVTRPAWRDPESRVVVRTAWRHFSAFVPLVHVPFDGEGYGRSRYALASDWLGAAPAEVDEANAQVAVARRYLAAFGPASIEDLAAYVGRGKGGITPWRRAVATLGDEALRFTDDGGRTLYDLADAPRPAEEAAVPPRLLARWDSLLLSHAAKHRRRVIADEHRGAVFTRNADVLPTFLVDGFVAGTWELRRDEAGVAIELRPFDKLAGHDRTRLVAEAERVLAILEPSRARSVRFGA